MFLLLFSYTSKLETFEFCDLIIIFGCCYFAGDVDKLDFRTRIDLSNLLDVRAEGKDVFALAEKLGFGNLRNVLDGMETSPTRFLLDYYEASDGTVAQLKESLRNIHRGDAVSVLEKNTKGRSHA